MVNPPPANHQSNNANIDLSNPPPNQQWSVTLENKEHDSDRRLRVVTGYASRLFALAALSLIFYYCWETIHEKTATADASKWAFATMSGITGTLIGFLFKK